MEAIREEQEENFHSFEQDPSRKSHPMVKVQLLSVTEAERGKLLQYMNTTNDQVSQGLQADTLPLKIMTVRRTMKNLTEKQVAEFPSEVGFEESVPSIV